MKTFLILKCKPFILPLKNTERYLIRCNVFWKKESIDYLNNLSFYFSIEIGNTKKMSFSRQKEMNIEVFCMWRTFFLLNKKTAKTSLFCNLYVKIFKVNNYGIKTTPLTLHLCMLHFFRACDIGPCYAVPKSLMILHVSFNDCDIFPNEPMNSTDTFIII